LLYNRSARRMRNSCQYIGKLIHKYHYTIRCNELQLNFTGCGKGRRGYLFLSLRAKDAGIGRQPHIFA
jgi:hypothetical protein